MEESPPTQTANDVYFLTCSIDQKPCPAEAQSWTLVDPYTPPTRERVAELSHEFFLAFFLPTIAIALLAWGVRLVVGTIR